MIVQHFTTEMMQTTPVNEVVGDPGTATLVTRVVLIHFLYSQLSLPLSCIDPNLSKKPQYPKNTLVYGYHPYGKERCNYCTNWDKEIADRILSAFYELDNKQQAHISHLKSFISYKNGVQ